METDEPATSEVTVTTEEAMAQPATEPPAETTENGDAHMCSQRPRDVRCGSGQSRVDSRRKAPSGAGGVSEQRAASVILISSTTRRARARASGAGKCEKQIRGCESKSEVRDALKEERSEWSRASRR